MLDSLAGGAYLWDVRRMSRRYSEGDRAMTDQAMTTATITRDTNGYSADANGDYRMDPGNTILLTTGELVQVLRGPRRFDISALVRRADGSLVHVDARRLSL